jgi:hypothetical protein
MRLVDILRYWAPAVNRTGKADFSAWILTIDAADQTRKDEASLKAGLLFLPVKWKAPYRKMRVTSSRQCRIGRRPHSGLFSTECIQ